MVRFGTALALLALSAPLRAQSNGIREVQLGPNTVVAVNAKVGFTTAVLLPPDEEWADLVYGDTATWTVVGTANIVHITALKAGAESNLNVVLPDRSVISFVLREGKVPIPDLKIVLKGDASRGTTQRKFVAQEVHEEQLRAVESELVSLRAAVSRADADAEQRVATFKTTYPLKIRRYDAQAMRIPPFFVDDLWADDDFTWIRMRARELPTIYEVVDGKPAMVSPIALPGNGIVTTYQIPKVIGDGYLSLGGKKWTFRETK
jgi:conjugative transfer protein CagX